MCRAQESRSASVHPTSLTSLTHVNEETHSPEKIGSHAKYGDPEKIFWKIPGVTSGKPKKHEGASEVWKKSEYKLTREEQETHACDP